MTDFADSASTPSQGATANHNNRRPIMLPKTSDEWAEADSLLEAQVIPLVLQAATPEEKNSILCDLAYDALKERFGVKPLPRAQRKLQQKLKQHDRALKKVTEQKNAARRTLRRAKRDESDTERVHALAGKFLSLLREHSRLKRISARKYIYNEGKLAREQCHKNFWRYAKSLLDDNTTSQVNPEFSAESARAYFSEVYKSSACSFEAPSWMPLPPPPREQMSIEPITAEELTNAIRRSKSSSSPSPIDQLPYMLFKRCPSLSVALLDLFNSVLSHGEVPSGWKAAVVKLIGKSSAQTEPTAPGNFRPIALTPTVSKLLSGILKDRWLRHMTTNGYLDSDIQKAFLPVTPGVTEHQSKLAAIINAARRSKRSLAVAWLDIANAYGSVHHSLIQFVLQHYHAPPEFCHLLRSWYSGLSATIATQAWETPPIPLQIGVYQGDPLSVVIFLTVMNTLSDILKRREDLGFPLPNSSLSINQLTILVSSVAPQQPANIFWIWCNVGSSGLSCEPRSPSATAWASRRQQVG